MHSHIHTLSNLLKTQPSIKTHTTHRAPPTHLINDLSDILRLRNLPTGEDKSASSGSVKILFICNSV